jgi:hypothetical protein
MTAEASGASGAIVSFSATANDVVDGPRPVTCAPPSGATFALGTTTVNCSASDRRGNTATGSFSVTVRDTTPPALSLPGDITAEATSAGGAAVTYSASAADLVDGPVTPDCAPPSGSTFQIGATPVTCTATDAHGNSATGGFTVRVRDTTPPTLTLPANMTLVSPSGAALTVTFTASASDLVAGPVPVSCTPPSGSLFSLGTTTVACMASDPTGNKATGGFTVTVQRGPLVLGAPDLPGAEVGIAYSAPLVTGGQPPFKLKFKKGAFPAGLAFSTQLGTLSGTPTKATLGTSPKTFTVQITDQAAASATGAFTIVIAKPLQVSTMRLAAGTHGQPYSASLIARGGVAPYTWSLTSGALPVGLALDPTTGAITGVPAQAGSVSLTFQVTDALGDGAQSVPLTLSIR